METRSRKTSSSTEDNHSTSNKVATNRFRNVPLSSSLYSFARDPFVVVTCSDHNNHKEEDFNTREEEHSLLRAPLILPKIVVEDDVISFTTEASFHDSDQEKSHEISDHSADEQDDNIELQLQRKMQKTKRDYKKIAMVISLFMFITFTYVGYTQSLKCCLSSDAIFYAPHFLTWFNSNWLVFSLPLYFLCSKCSAIKKYSHFSELKQDSLSMFSEDGTLTKKVVLKMFLLSELWFLFNYCFYQALGYISASEITSIFGSCSSFIYLLSWVFLHDAFVPLRITAVLISIVGIVLMSHAEGAGTQNFIGTILAIIASALSATFQVLVNRVLEIKSLDQRCILVTIIGGICLSVNCLSMILFVAIEADKIIWSLIPWPFICASAIFNLLHVFSTLLGNSVTKNVDFVATGLFISFPINIIIDATVRKRFLRNFHAVGIGCITVGFVLLLLPDRFFSNCLSKVIEIRKLKKQTPVRL